MSSKSKAADSEHEGAEIRKKRKVQGGVGGSRIVTIKSSDGVNHDIAAYHLQSSSPVFRDMIEAGGDQDEPLVLTDPDIETSQVVALALRIIEDHEINTEPLYEEDISILIPAVRFLLKYECYRELQLIEDDILEMTLYMTQTLDLVLIATWLPRAQACAHAIRYCGVSEWGLKGFGGSQDTDDEGEVEGHWRTGILIDPATWSLSQQSMVPPKALWALLRASRMVDWRNPKEAQISDMADEYERLMTK